LTYRLDRFNVSNIVAPNILWHVIDRFGSLRSLGFAVEHFPHYVNNSLRPHRVDVVLMTVIIAGRGKHVIDEISLAAARGDVGITHYGQAHDLLTGRAGMRVYNVYLDLQHHRLPALPPEFDRVVPALFPLHSALRNRLNRAVHFRLPDVGFACQLLTRIDRELEMRPPAYAFTAQSYLSMFLIECCRGAMDSGLALLAPKAAPPWLEHIRQWLDNDYLHSPTLTDLADEHHISIGHLCRAFLRYSGKTVIEYLQERRLAVAMHKLATTDAKVLSVALESGFRDLSYFNRTFRRFAGKTPGAYRRALRG
jgi:AraC-like DNA-binding protein